MTRPEVLSDPHQDHTEEACRAILARRDEDLTWVDFRRLFGPLSAGTFRETVYFLPLAFQFLRDQRDHHEEFHSGFAYWVSEHGDELERIGVRTTVAAKLRSVLDSWAGSFRVTHYDQEACRAKGWVLRYDDIVHNSQSVAGFVHDLVAYRTWASVAEEFVAGIAAALSPTEAAWFLEFARWQEEGPFDRVMGEPRPPEERAHEEAALRERVTSQGIPEPDAFVAEIMESGRRSDAVRSDPIRRLVRDPELRQRAARVVLSSSLHDPGSTYWRDTFACLGVLA
jgi:hypothetical protein